MPRRRRSAAKAGTAARRRSAWSYRRACGCLATNELLRRFQVDAGRFFTDELSGLADRSLDARSVSATGLFDPAFIRSVRGQPPRTGLRWHYFMLYLMLGAQIWLDQFEGRS